jgi:uncharacterized repeat protein (TIGR03803 family)
MFNSPWLRGFALAAGVLLHGDFASAGTLTTLYAFTGGTDGGEPASALIPGPNGSLYGTTALGGQFPNSNGYGTVFQLSPPVGRRSRCSKPSFLAGLVIGSCDAHQ